MYKITNDSGHSFIANASRKTIESSSKPVILNELHIFVRLYQAIYISRHKSWIHVAAVEEKELIGETLLAEAIVAQLPDVENLIYLEWFHHAIYTVAMIKNEIIIDNYANDLQTRQMINALDKEPRYKIYTCGAGDILASVNLNFEKAGSLIQSATPDPGIALTAPSLAMKPYNYRRAYLQTATALLFVFIGIYLSTPEETLEKAAVFSQQPYQELREALAGPPVSNQILFMSRLLDSSFLLGNWRAKNITMTNDEISVVYEPVISLPGFQPPVDELKQIQAAFGGGISFNNQLIVYKVKPAIADRPEPDAVYPAGSRLSYIIESLGEVGLFVDNPPRRRGEHSEISVTFSMADISPAMLEVVSHVLYHEPVVLASAIINTTESSNINATFNLTVYGI